MSRGRVFFVCPEVECLETSCFRQHGPDHVLQPDGERYTFPTSNRGSWLPTGTSPVDDSGASPEPRDHAATRRCFQSARKALPRITRFLNEQIDKNNRLFADMRSALRAVEAESRSLGLITMSQLLQKDSITEGQFAVK